MKLFAKVKKYIKNLMWIIDTKDQGQNSPIFHNALTWQH